MAKKQPKPKKSAFNVKGIFVISWLRFDEEPSGLYYKEDANGAQMFAVNSQEAKEFKTERAAWDFAEHLMSSELNPFPYFDVEQIVI